MTDPLTRGPFVIVCRAHSGGRILSEAFQRNGIQMGNIHPHTKDSTFFAVRRNEIIKSIIEISFVYRDLKDVQKKQYQTMLKSCLSQYYQREITDDIAPFGWKFGESLFVAPVLMDAVESSRVIHIIRDGRDVMVSRIPARFEKNIHEAFNELIIFGPDPAKSFLYHAFQENSIKDFRNALEMQHWVTCIEFGLTCRSYTRQYLEVRYEDLCRKPVEVLSLIFNFLGHPITKECADWAQRSVHQNRIGKWLFLNEDEMNLPMQVGRTMLQRLGYIS